MDQPPNSKICESSTKHNVCVPITVQNLSRCNGPCQRILKSATQRSATPYKALQSTWNHCEAL